MILFRFASFSLDAFTSVDGGVNKFRSGRGPRLSFACSRDSDGYADFGLDAALLLSMDSSMTPGMDVRLLEPVDDKEVLEVEFSLLEIER